MVYQNRPILIRDIYFPLLSPMVSDYREYLILLYLHGRILPLMHAQIMYLLYVIVMFIVQCWVAFEFKLSMTHDGIQTMNSAFGEYMFYISCEQAI